MVGLMTGRSAAVVLAAIGPMLLLAVLLPPIGELPGYLEFADRRTILGVPNFWNVVTNLPFLAVAIWGLRAFRSKTAFLMPWERADYAIVLGGLALTTFGSTYFHWTPTPVTLFWDRLPMTLLFMPLFAATIGERLSMAAGRALLVPLTVAGIASAVWWHATGDLRGYVVVQYVPVLALPLLLATRPPRYSNSGWVWSMVALYVLAKVFEVGDRQIGRVIATGGHPWKHLAASAAMLSYCVYVSRRVPLRLFDNTCPPSVS